MLEDEENLSFLHGTLKIHVLEARDLPDTDNAFFNVDRNDLTDPYVTVALDDIHLLKTAYQRNTLNPVFDEKFSIPVCHSASSLKVQVKDKEHVGAKVVGTTLISVEDIVSGEPLEGWFDIIVGSGGEVQVSDINCKTTLEGTLDSPFVHGAVQLYIQYFSVGSCGDDNKVLQESYFSPKDRNKVTLYQDADTPMLPVFEGVLNPDGAPYEPTRCWRDIFETINGAQKFIYICGWSVYTAVNLLRGEEAAENEDSNVGELLKSKANDGVRVCVMTWNEKSNDSGMMEGMMGTHDEDTYAYFNGTDVACANVPRYKESWLNLGGQFVSTLYTHHQKTVICDAEMPDGGDMRRVVAFVGGLDITDGRFDSAEFPLFSTLFTKHAGDFYQNCTMGTTCETGPRQPWHDIHAKVEGPAALDICENFVDRWTKQNPSQVDLLFPLDGGELDLEADGPDDQPGGPWVVQLLRSITSDSAVCCDERANCLHRKYGRLVDNSIMKSYINLIRNAQSFIYMDNQYFLGSAFSWLERKNTLCHHLVPRELTQKIVSKIEAGEQFKVYIVIPMYPEGDPSSVPSQEILHWQYLTMQSMYARIARTIERCGTGTVPTDYLNFYCLGKRESPDELPEGLVDPAPGTGAELVRSTLRHPIYVHSKLMIVDDDYVVVGSANINQRSLGGNRDSEICIGAFQPNHSVADGPPRGDIHTFRMALWAAHLGGYDPIYEDPGSDECLARVREVSEEFWRVYTSEEPEHSDVHLLPYPLYVAESGELSSMEEPWNCFPDTSAPVVGAPSGVLPAKLTT